MSQPQGKQTFYCPHCNQKLSFLDGTIIKMVGRLRAENFSCKTMVYVPAQLGQYGVIVGEGVRIAEGAKFDLECTNGGCKRSFTAAYDDDLAEIRMTDARGHEFAVVFNRVYGRRATFILDFKGKDLVDSYGEHAGEHARNFDKPLNFFGN